ncbi:hypothetical protein KSS87_012245, partial [Heliosperma pusillum]
MEVHLLWKVQHLHFIKVISMSYLLRLRLLWYQWITGEPLNTLFLQPTTIRGLRWTGSDPALQVLSLGSASMLTRPGYSW